MRDRQTNASLDLIDVHTGYGRHTVIHGVSARVPLSESVVLLGQNGAGKSTLLRAVFGLNPILRGTVTVAGKTLVSRLPTERIGHGIAYVPQGRGVFRDLSVTDNLRAAAATMRSGDRQVTEVLARFPELSDLAGAKAGVLSGGQARTLAIGMALVRRPRWLLLDEPTIGLSPGRIDSVFRLLRELQDNEGLGLLIAEQNVTAAVTWFDRAMCLRGGVTRWTGDCAALRAMTPVELAELL